MELSATFSGYDGEGSSGVASDEEEQGEELLGGG